MESLNVAWVGTLIFTSNLGSTYSATSKLLLKIWSTTLTVIFQLPRTGCSLNCNSDENTPCVVLCFRHSLMRLPLPSYKKLQMIPLIWEILYKQIIIILILQSKAICNLPWRGYSIMRWKLVEVKDLTQELETWPHVRVCKLLCLFGQTPNSFYGCIPSW